MILCITRPDGVIRDPLKRHLIVWRYGLEVRASGGDTLVA